MRPHAAASLALRRDGCTHHATPMPIDVERKHGNGVDAHGPGIGAGRDDGRDHETPQDGVADVLPQEPRAHDAEHGQEEDEDRHLEADAQAENDGEEEAGVVLDGDHGREVVADIDDENLDARPAAHSSSRSSRRRGTGPRWPP